MSVRKRKDGRWQYDVTLRKKGQEIRRRGAAPNRKTALERESEVRRKMLAGAFVSGKSPFFSDFAAEFLAVYASANNKPSERASKEMILRKHLTPFFGTKRVDQIGAQDLETYKAEKRAAGLSDKTINNHLICLGKLFVVAREWGRAGELPAVKRLKVELPAVDFLNYAEARQLIATIPPPDEWRWYAMAMLAMGAGLRISELVALQWGDVVLSSSKLVVRHNQWNGQSGTPKGGKAKEVPLSYHLCAILRGLNRTEGTNLVFASDEGRMLRREECTAPLRRLCAGAGVRRVGWHSLRHSFGSHLAMRGVPLKAIQELLRHESIAMTLRYAHLSPGMTADAVEGLYDRDWTATERNG